jgi:hypothetical protein
VINTRVFFFGFFFAFFFCRSIYTQNQPQVKEGNVASLFNREAAKLSYKVETLGSRQIVSVSAAVLRYDIW